MADGIYHAGFDIERGAFLNEDGDRNARLETVANWLNLLLRDDLANGVLANAGFAETVGVLAADSGSQPADTPSGTAAAADEVFAQLAE